MTFLNKSRAILLPKTFIVALLFSLYSLAFIITPYWNLAPSFPTRLAILLVTLVAGTAWSVVCGSALRVCFHYRGLAFFALLLALLVALNYRQITGGIPWRGDEDFHILRTLYLTNKMVLLNKWAAAGLGAFAVFIILAWVKPGWAERIGALIVLSVVFFISVKDPFEGVSSTFLVRYPLVINWFAAVAPTAAAMVNHPYHEALYRIIPLFFAAALAWAFQHHLPPSTAVTRLLWGMAIATIPLVFYYSSILYLEMPAVFLMTVVCFRLRDLLQGDVAQLKNNAGWYSLILIGFIKETAVPFLVCYLVTRWVVQFLQRKPASPLARRLADIRMNQPDLPLIHRIASELSVAFAVLFPAFFYLVLRSNFSTFRNFGFQWSNLIEPRAYSALAQSFVDQFGIFLLFFIAGCILLLRRKEYAIVGFMLMVILGTPLFHIVDDWIYAGYSRFNLFLLPPVLLGTSVFAGWVSAWKRGTGAGVACLAILAGLVLSPVNLDGSKRPYWGSYNIDTAEHYYPYREAIAWLKETYPAEPVIAGGFTYPYYFEFYEQVFQWKPGAVIERTESSAGDPAALTQLLLDAQEGGYQLVLFHVLDKEIPPLSNTGAFHQEMTFRNAAHVLVVYHRGNK